MEGRELLILGLSPATLVGSAFWALGFYLICGDWLDLAIDRISENYPVGAISAVSIVPFLFGGIALEWGLEAISNPSWGISCAILTCGGFGIFRLGQLDNRAYEQTLKERQEKGDRRK